MSMEAWGIAVGAGGIVAAAILGYFFWRLTSQQTNELRSFLVDAIASTTDDPDTMKRLMDDRLKSGVLRGKVVKDPDGKYHIAFAVTATEGGQRAGNRHTLERGKRLNPLTIGILFFALFSSIRLLLNPDTMLSYDMWAFLALSVLMALVIFGQMLRQAPTTLPRGVEEFTQGWRQLSAQARSLPEVMRNLVSRLKNAWLTVKGFKSAQLRLRPLWEQLKSDWTDYLRFALEYFAVFAAALTFIIGWINGVGDGFVFGMGLVWLAFILMDWVRLVPFKWLVPGSIVFVILALTQVGITPWAFLAVGFYVAVFFIAKFFLQPYGIEP